MRQTHRMSSGALSGARRKGARRAGAGARGSQPGMRYPWLRFHLSSAQRLAGLVGVAAGIALAWLYSQYMQSADAAPDSIYGLVFAVAGTLLLLLVGAGYTLQKRWGARWPGRLHTFLAWHLVGGLLGVLLIWMHSMGSFEQPSGTYAFYGLLGIAASGLIGRFLDYVCPHLAAQAALGAVTASGEERLEELARTFERGQARRPQAILRARREARIIQRALRRERCFLLLIRLWRPVHILISLVALGLLAWHLVFALNWLLSGY